MDCLEGMKQMPDNSVDLIVTDPPYGFLPETTVMGGTGVAANKIYPVVDWDKPLSEETIQQILRVSKNQIIFGAEHLAPMLPKSRGWYCWDKLRPEGTTFSECEFVYTSFNIPTKMIRFMWNGMLRESWEVEKNIRYHPTQKPVEIMKLLIKNHSKEGDLIIDPFMGSGTTAVACKQLNRNFIGFEISPEYCEIANKRLSQETLFSSLDSQKKLV